MLAAQPFRFGANIGPAESFAVVSERARRMEALGYAIVDIGDHFATAFAPGPVLTAAAMATTTLRIGCTVFANDFRHPAVVAKEAASIDVLSGGRFECGIGAGWNKAEYEQVGIVFESPQVRVNRLMEAVEVIKGLWGENPLTFSGQHYSIRELNGVPKPVQRPHPPLFIGGGGKRLLSYAARSADIVGILGQALPQGGVEVASVTEAALAAKVGWIRAEAGERFAQLQLNLLLWNVVMTDDPRAAAESLAKAGASSGLAAAMGGAPWLYADQILASPYFQIGSVDQIVENLRALRERFGIAYFTVFARDMEAFAPVVGRIAGQ
jgi:probable F420-dependent oxidoreductase